MARVTVEDCLEHVENRFALVLLAAERAHQLEMRTSEPMVKEDNDKPTVIALREIALGHDVESMLRAEDMESDDIIPMDSARSEAPVMTADAEAEEPVTQPTEETK